MILSLYLASFLLLLVVIFTLLFLGRRK